MENNQQLLAAKARAFWDFFQTNFKAQKNSGSDSAVFDFNTFTVNEEHALVVSKNEKGKCTIIIKKWIGNDDEKNADEYQSMMFGNVSSVDESSSIYTVNYIMPDDLNAKSGLLHFRPNFTPKMLAEQVKYYMDLNSDKTFVRGVNLDMSFFITEMMLPVFAIRRFMRLTETEEPEQENINRILKKEAVSWWKTVAEDNDAQPNVFMPHLFTPNSLFVSRDGNTYAIPEHTAAVKTIVEKKQKTLGSTYFEDQMIRDYFAENEDIGYPWLDLQWDHWFANEKEYEAVIDKYTASLSNALQKFFGTIIQNLPDENPNVKTQFKELAENSISGEVFDFKKSIDMLKEFVLDQKGSDETTSGQHIFRLLTYFLNMEMNTAALSKNEMMMLLSSAVKNCEAFIRCISVAIYYLVRTPPSNKI